MEVMEVERYEIFGRPAIVPQSSAGFPRLSLPPKHRSCEARRRAAPSSCAPGTARLSRSAKRKQLVRHDRYDRSADVGVLARIGASTARLVRPKCSLA